MTLPELLESSGIKNHKDLERLTGLSRQLCWLLWTGQRLPGRKSGELIAAAAKVSLVAVLAVDRDGRKLGRKPRPRSPLPPSRG